MRLWKRKSRHPLDDALFHWPDGSPFLVRHMLRSVECKGITGSGKSSGTLEHFIACLAAHPRASMTIIAQKPEEKAQYQEAFARAGRKDDLLVIEEGGKLRLNFFEHGLPPNADTRARTELVTILGEGLQQRQAGADDRFWRMMEERILYNAIGALELGGTFTAPNLQAFIANMPDADTLNDPERNAAWEQQYHFKVMKAAEAAPKTTRQAHDWSLINKFLSYEMVVMDDKPKTSALAGVNNTLHSANTGLAREMTASFTNVTPRVIDHGKSLLINFPFSQYGLTGRYIAGGWKYLVQRHILNRTWNPSGFFNVLMLDEFQESITEFDAPFISQCRSHGGAMLCLTQTVHSEYGRMAGHAGHHKADMLLSNYGTHIYHLCDPGTAEAASKLLGQRRERFITPSYSHDHEVWDLLTGNTQASVSISEQYAAILQPSVLMASLRTGGAPHYCVDGVVIRTGEPFRSGENYQFITFRQQR
jgi:TraM recognition site of TraD and TraG